MHQEHTIPWNALASNFKFSRDDPHFTPRRTALFPRNLPNQAQALNHFVRVLQTTITTFSETERAKYPASFDAPTSGRLFSDELRARYPEFLDEKNQRIEHWIERVHAYEDAHKIQYWLNHGDLADVVKILIDENQMQPLLMLARHPQVPLGTLCHLSWGHHFGFSRVMESALLAYVLLNLFAALDILRDDGGYLEMGIYRYMVRTSTEEDMDYPAQQLPHCAYLNALPENPATGLPEVHHDFAGLKQYVKTMFALLYRYDMVVRECGRDPEWESEIRTVLSMISG
ncbi:hypothetical protein LshimejAT787_0805620 [Lyophyllum shimeji]|uniref:Uncharacterized protein n=1 Tax=Lyophyllum shimeji TaxID=47721 RepID=A0A9P3US05_LYOSH|nr:hypothetical protein LshimejAT787_0805620 [Lyophyllum shimeji]